MNRSSLCLLSLLVACGTSDDVTSGGPAGSIDAGPGADASIDARTSPPVVDPCPPSNPYCGDGGTRPPTNACTSPPIDLRPAGVKVVVAVDGSKSMTTFWTQMRDSVKGMMSANPNIQFGADLFWAEVVESFEEGLKRINACGDTEHKLLELGLNQSGKLDELFGAEPPGPGVFFWDFTPVADPLNYYLVNDTPLSDPNTTNYLVLISDGNDNCYGNFWAGEDDKVNAYQKLARELVKKNIRVLPIGFNAASEQQMITGGAIETDFVALNTIAQHGGSGVDKALAADDPEQLAQAFSAVSQRIGSCRFQVPAVSASTVNPFALEFRLNNQLVARDRTATEGWNFVRGETSEVEFYGQACQAVRAGVPLQAQQACSTEKLCGNASSRISAKPRAVQYLLDRSGSMAACSAGFLDCIPGLTTGLTWWGVAARAISNAVTAPINDDVEFGLKYFPDRGALDCTVGDGPAVAPAPGTAIELLGDVLHTLPGGATPLLSALENVAANPGRLAEAEVAGALILISDGGESCVGMDQAERVMRIEAATRSLHERGIQVFAVRFGAKGADFADQDAQLRAIAREGGTATGDPNDPNNTPYLEAPDADALNKSLGTISQALASCALELGNVDAKADKTKVNLYLDGDVVPFDAAGTKQSGWGWKNPEQTELELYGPTCDGYKTSRTTSIVIEVGCEPIVVI
ncbi:MAG: VWA domain-containing protein [Polyangiales bacterium]